MIKAVPTVGGGACVQHYLESLLNQTFTLNRIETVALHRILGNILLDRTWQEAEEKDRQRNAQRRSSINS